MISLVIFGAKYLIFLSVLITGIFFFIQLKPDQKKFLLYAVITLPVIFIIAKLSSLLYFDPRPFVVGHFIPLIPHAPDNGFPSDHTLLGAALAVIVFAFSKRVGILLFIIAILVGAARVYLGIHHIVDIIGSLVISIGVGILLYQLIVKRFDKKIRIIESL